MYIVRPHESSYRATHNKKSYTERPITKFHRSSVRNSNSFKPPRTAQKRPTCTTTRNVLNVRSWFLHFDARYSLPSNSPFNSLSWRSSSVSYVFLLCSCICSYVRLMFSYVFLCILMFSYMFLMCFLWLSHVFFMLFRMCFLWFVLCVFLCVFLCFVLCVS